MYFQQGDVILERVDDGTMPKGKPVRAERGSLVLERGEATGHAHRVDAEGGVNLFNVAGVLYLQNMAKTMLLWLMTQALSGMARTVSLFPFAPPVPVPFLSYTSLSMIPMMMCLGVVLLDGEASND